jgi:2-methylisocitrate lyase-like PEP mutase family enzyme
MSNARPSIADKRRSFHALHQSGCFVIPNPWDVGSALYLQSLGFKALATTSSGFAWSQGLRDGAISLDQALAHFHTLVEATDLPINADFEGGFAADPASVADHSRLAIEAGVAGLSIEDSTGTPNEPLYEIEFATERIRATRRAIDNAGGDTLLVGRAECFLVGRRDLKETIARLKAYAEAGADCLYAPGITSREDIEAMVKAVAPKPVNVLVSSATTMTLKDFEALGVRRVSVGGALARTAWRGFIHAARLMADHGRFDELPGSPAGINLDAFFQKVNRSGPTKL